MKKIEVARTAVRERFILLSNFIRSEGERKSVFYAVGCISMLLGIEVKVWVIHNIRRDLNAYKIKNNLRTYRTFLSRSLFHSLAFIFVNECSRDMLSFMILFILHFLDISRLAFTHMAHSAKPVSLNMHFFMW